MATAAHQFLNQTGAYQAGEGQFLALPKNWRGDITARGIVVCHGRGGNAWQMVADPYTGHLARACVAAGYAYMSIDAGGTAAWGSPSAMTAVTNAADWLIANVGVRTNRVFVAGFSMGGLTALTWGRLNANRCAGIAAICPALDLTALRAASPTFASEMDAAYGSQAAALAAVPVYSPYAAAASSDAYAGLPTKLWYASDDTVALTATQTAFLARCPSVASVNMGAVGHTPLPVDADMFAAFFTSN